MNINTRTITRLLAVTALAMTTVSASAQTDWPNQPVKVIVPWAAGGTVDFAARQIAQKITEQTGKAFVVENKAGASGTIGYSTVAKSAPDGTTALLYEASYATLPSLFSKLSWDYENDLMPVGTVITTPMALVVSASSPFKSTQELIDYARQHPGKLNVASGGVGSTPHIASEIFKNQAQIDIVHIPFKGGGEALLAVMAGNADLLLTATPTALAQAKSGKIRTLAVSSKERLVALPDVPTINETLKGYEFDNWYGVAMPKGTPPAVITKFNALLVNALADASLRERFISQGAQIRLSTPEEFGKLLRDETRRYTEISRKAGIQPQ